MIAPMGHDTADFFECNIEISARAVIRWFHETAGGLKGAFNPKPRWNRKVPLALQAYDCR
jgi:hypothetical protein